MTFENKLRHRCYRLCSLPKTAVDKASSSEKLPSVPRLQCGHLECIKPEDASPVSTWLVGPFLFLVRADAIGEAPPESWLKN